MARKKIALYPFGASARDFKVGQKVQRLITSSTASVFVGTVLAVNPSIEKVDVQWPIGIVREDPEWLIPVSDSLGIEPTVKSVSAKIPTDTVWNMAMMHLSKLANIFSDANALKSIGKNEVYTYDVLSSNYGQSIADNTIREVVTAAYQGKKASLSKDLSYILENFYGQY